MKKIFVTPVSALASLAFLLSTGCVKMGTKFSVKKTEGVLTGMSKQEVLKIMGKPNVVSYNVVEGEKLEMWTWTFTSSGGLIFYKAKANSFAIAFSKNGTVTDSPRSLATTSGSGFLTPPSVTNMVSPLPAVK